jgi:hypothetical protein
MLGMNVRTAFTSASYRETLAELVARMATAEPHVHVVKTIAWLFAIPEGEVRKDIKVLWKHLRFTENNEKRLY